MNLWNLISIIPVPVKNWLQPLRVDYNPYVPQIYWNICKFVSFYPNSSKFVPLESTFSEQRDRIIFFRLKLLYGRRRPLRKMKSLKKWNFCSAQWPFGGHCVKSTHVVWWGKYVVLADTRRIVCRGYARIYQCVLTVFFLSALTSRT